MKVRLYVMMFLQYFVQGCYLPVISAYLQNSMGFDAEQVGNFGSALAVGPLIAPFIIGQIVDRHVATQYVLSACHFAGGALMLLFYFMAIGRVFPESTDLYMPILIVGALYSTLYVPSLMLTNSLTFHHLADREREFPTIRLWGTIGFVVPAWLIEGYFLAGLEGDALNKARAVILALSGIGGLVMGVYSLTLPNTPPGSEDKKDMAPRKVLKLLRLRNFLTLVLISFLIAIVHKYYFVWNSPFVEAILKTGDVSAVWVLRISSIGQVFEVVVMAFLGFSIKRFGFKITMLVGSFAYLLRCLIFAGAVTIEGMFPLALTLVCIGQALHGFCFGCFIAAAFIYTDRVAPVDVRGTMQNFYGTFVLSLGFFIGGFVSGQIGEKFTQPAPEATQTATQETSPGVLHYRDKKTGKIMQRDWPGIWLSGAAMAGVAFLGLMALFPKNHDEQMKQEKSP
ncbi:MAG: MFS transporter [Planctomycetaceae bacterium]